MVQKKNKFRGWEKWRLQIQGKTIQKCLNIKGRNVKAKHNKIIDVKLIHKKNGEDF